METVYKAFETESKAIQYANKIAKTCNVILSVVKVGNVYHVGA